MKKILICLVLALIPLALMAQEPEPLLERHGSTGDLLRGEVVAIFYEQATERYGFRLRLNGGATAEADCGDGMWPCWSIGYLTCSWEFRDDGGRLEYSCPANQAGACVVVHQGQDGAIDEVQIGAFCRSSFSVEAFVLSSFDAFPNPPQCPEGYSESTAIVQMDAAPFELGVHRPKLVMAPGVPRPTAGQCIQAVGRLERCCVDGGPLLRTLAWRAFPCLTTSVP